MWFHEQITGAGQLLVYENPSSKRNPCICSKKEITSGENQYKKWSSSSRKFISQQCLETGKGTCEINCAACSSSVHAGKNPTTSSASQDRRPALRILPRPALATGRLAQRASCPLYNLRSMNCAIIRPCGGSTAVPAPLPDPGTDQVPAHHPAPVRASVSKIPGTERVLRRGRCLGEVLDMASFRSPFPPEGIWCD